MKVIVNALALLTPLTGIGQYIRHLFTEISNNQEIDLNFYYGLSCHKVRTQNQINSNMAKTADQVSQLPVPGRGMTRNLNLAYKVAKKIVPKPRALRRFAERIAFSYHAQRGGEEAVYHEPNFYPLPYRGPTVVSIHDLSCFDHPETHPKERVEMALRELPRAVDRADRIITISHATANAIKNRFGVADERIVVTHLAAGSQFGPRHHSLLIDPLGKIGLTPGGYLLCVGTLEPRKNLVTLFQAYAALNNALRRNFPLIVVGMPGWHTSQLESESAKLVSKGEIIFLGYVPDALMPSIYAGALAFVYPSIYEGFGLPPLEAMASGIPVITSNSTSLPEVVGDAGIQLPPLDVDGFRDSIQALLEDANLRQRFGAAGLLRASMFSWQKCAEQTLLAYRQAVTAHGKRG